MEEFNIEHSAIPQWHIDLLKERLIDYKKNPNQALDFDEAVDDIEKDL